MLQLCILVLHLNTVDMMLSSLFYFAMLVLIDHPQDVLQRLLSRNIATPTLRNRILCQLSQNPERKQRKWDLGGKPQGSVANEFYGELTMKNPWTPRGLFWGRRGPNGVCRSRDIGPKCVQVNLTLQGKVSAKL